MSIINDGHSTTYEFAGISNVKFLEKEVTPPGADGGGANDVTTMRNVRFRTMQPKKLLSFTESSVTVAWDPEIYDGDLESQLQVVQLITITFPNGDTVAFYGWIDSFVPGANVEGAQPTAEIKVIPGNLDENANEVAPVWTAAIDV